MKLHILILNIILIATNTVFAQINDEHLEPVNGLFDSTDNRISVETKIREYLIDGLDDYPKLRFLKFPSRDPEEVFNLSFNQTTNLWEITYRTRGIMIHRLKNSDIIKYPMTEIDKTVSKELGEKLYEVSLKMVNRTKFFEKKKTGFDGVNYYFSVFDSQIKAGKIWSPKPYTKTGKLVSICEDVIKYISGEVDLYPKLLNDINTLIIELEER